jgi:6-phosphogluconolactonase
MKINIYKSNEILAEELANWMCDVIGETLKNQEFFSLVLSGGDTPKALYQKLSSEEYKNKINWKRIHIFWGDERVVPFTDEKSNAGMAYKLLIDHIDIPASQVHIIRTDIQPNFAVDEYRKLLHSQFDHTFQSFDLVLLGMGDDGHTLSLFPNSPLIEEQENWVNAVFSKKKEMYRISLMPLIINRASKIAFMVQGKTKAAVLKEVMEGSYNPTKYPAQIIKPVNGELYWFVDQAAASELKAEESSI